MNIHPHVYPELACEFTASIRKSRFDGCVEFQMFNKSIRETHTNICEAIGVSNEGYEIVKRGFNATQFLEEISGEPSYNASRAKASSIKSLSLKVAHRILSFTIFGNIRSSGNVPLELLFVLWCMLNKENCNLVMFMLHKLWRSLPLSGAVTCGMLATQIAIKRKLLNPDNTPLYKFGKEYLDFQYLKHIDVCMWNGRKWVLLAETDKRASKRKVGESSTQAEEESEEHEEDDEEEEEIPNSEIIARLNQLENKLDAIEVNTNNRFDRMQTSIDGMSEKIDNYGEQMTSFFNNFYLHYPPPPPPPSDV